jgi:hypothetical protein
VRFAKRDYCRDFVRVSRGSGNAVAIDAKHAASRFDPKRTGVRLVDVPTEEQQPPSLTDEDAVAVVTERPPSIPVDDAFLPRRAR